MPFLALGLAVLLGLQAPVAPSASAGVTGRVLETDTKRPVSGAQVSLVPEARPQGGVFVPLKAETDAKLMANSIWSIAHGIVSIRIAKPQVDWPSITATLDHVLGSYLSGLRQVAA